MRVLVASNKTLEESKKQAKRWFSKNPNRKKVLVFTSKEHAECQKLGWTIDRFIWKMSKQCYGPNLFTRDILHTEKF